MKLYNDGIAQLCLGEFFSNDRILILLLILIIIMWLVDHLNCTHFEEFKHQFQSSTVDDMIGVHVYFHLRTRIIKQKYYISSTVLNQNYIDIYTIHIVYYITIRRRFQRKPFAIQRFLKISPLTQLFINIHKIDTKNTQTQANILWITSCHS